MAKLYWSPGGSIGLGESWRYLGEVMEGWMLTRSSYVLIRGNEYEDSIDGGNNVHGAATPMEAAKKFDAAEGDIVVEVRPDGKAYSWGVKRSIELTHISG